MKRALTVVAILATVGCGRPDQAFSIEGAAQIGDPALAKTVQAYYEAEAAGDWRATYDARHTAFRKTVDRELYEKTMTADFSKSKLESVRIVSVERTSARAFVTLEFIEASDSFFRKVRTKYTENTRWDFSDGRWHAYGPGKRAHISLNDPIVLEN